MDNATNTPVITYLNRQGKSAPAELPLSFFKSGQFLCLTPNCQGGLILQRPFYADFVGAGAAVGSSFDVNCTSVYAIGKVEFCVPATFSGRQQAFQQRMAYSHRLQEIVAEEAPLHRSILILNQLCEWVGDEEAKKIPDQLIARLAGVLTKTLKVAKETSVKQISKEFYRRGREPVGH